VVRETPFSDAFTSGSLWRLPWRGKAFRRDRRFTARAEPLDARLLGYKNQTIRNSLDMNTPYQRRILGVQLGNEARHFFLNGIAIVFDFLGADLTTGSENVTVGGDFGGGGGFTEAGHIGILIREGTKG